MKPHQLQQLSQHLQDAFLLVKTREECFAFLRDLMTESEILEFTQRLEIAQRLKEGESYMHIQEKTGVSSTTIARVGKFLNGEHQGYELVLKRLKQK